MIQLTKEQYNQIRENLDDLQKMLTDRVSEYHEVKGGQSERHAFCYYRQQVWETQYILNDAKEVKKPKSNS